MKTVLFVDDEKQITESYKRRMAKHPHIRTFTVNNVIVALEMLQSTTNLVITDWQMPDGGGKVIIEKCKQANIDVIVCSGSHPIELDGSVLWISKNNMSELLSTILQKLTEK